nr:MAG: hypothetical protein [Molluscum contagiosum virus]
MRRPTPAAARSARSCQGRLSILSRRSISTRRGPATGVTSRKRPRCTRAGTEMVYESTFA